MLRGIAPMSEKVFLATLQNSAKAVSANRETLVFVHGYNVSFAEAAYRTAQLACDLEVAGPVLMFSWPTQRSFLDYAADLDIVDLSTDALAKFLEDVTSEADLGTVHLAAHSMGSQLLARALETVSNNHPALTQKLFGQIVLAAPDIDVQSFNKKYAKPMERTSSRLTIYASANDNALLFSRFLRMGRPRVGEYAALVAGPSWLDSVDASTVDTSLVAHSYFGGRSAVISDIRAVLDRVAPRGRRLFPRSNYWTFQAPDDAYPLVLIGIVAAISAAFTSFVTWFVRGRREAFPWRLVLLVVAGSVVLTLLFTVFSMEVLAWVRASMGVKTP